jgi:type II secretory pathway pseudopilin PulG
MKRMNHFKSSTNFNQFGIGLIELLLVISIIAIIVAGAVSMYSNTNNSSKAQELTKGLSAMQAALHTVYGQMPDYTTLTENVIALSGGLPKSMVKGLAAAAEVVTTYGDITIAMNGGNNRQVDITYASGTIPTEVCNKFVPTQIGVVRNITVGGNAVTTPAEVVTGCSTDVGGGNVGAIVFTVD